jgi:sarcosine oxidase, subunit alpha
MRVQRESGWPSTEHDLLAVNDRLRLLLPVGFYYKTLLRPRWLWPLAEPLIRRAAGLGTIDVAREPDSYEQVHHHPGLLVVGAGVAGLAAALVAAHRGERVVVCDEHDIGATVSSVAAHDRIQQLRSELEGFENVLLLERSPAAGIYEGPLVPVAGQRLLHLVHPERVVVATGAVERHGVFPGNDLPGVFLGRGAALLARRHGLAPGWHVVLAGGSAEIDDHAEAISAAGSEVTIATAEIEQALGRRQLSAVVAGGTRISADALALSLTLVPRDGLLRQGRGLPVVGAGDAVDPGCTLAEAEASGRRAALSEETLVRERRLPRPARSGCLCLCEDVEVKDLELAWREGFRSTELLKRYTTATMGSCQGQLCLDHLRSFVADRAGAVETVSGPTTARPPVRGLTLEAAAAGIRDDVEHRTSLHDRHLELGATMEPAGEWERASHYGDVQADYLAVRKSVSVMDVGTLGKFEVGGPDATAFLERLYPCRVGDLEPGRIRYTVLLADTGFVVDDGLICARGNGRYYLTFSSIGAATAEATLKDWATTWGARVYVVNRTAAIGAINVAGPKARTLLQRLTDGTLDNEALPYLRHRELEVAGTPCTVIRLGFVGELSYELHHPADRSVELWNALLGAGSDLGIRPHGLEALRLLRLEKGHILIGQDTDYDSTPAKLGMSWAVKLDKPAFVGKIGLQRAERQPLIRKLAPIRFDGPTAPTEGSPVVVRGRHVGHLTSSRYSPVLGYGVALGWTDRVDDEFPVEVESGGMQGTVIDHAFYDPEGERLRA